MQIAGVVLPFLFVIVFGSDHSVKQHQPEAAPELEGASDLNAAPEVDDAIQENPPSEDFMALRQRNAELALQVEEMTSELHQLQSDKKMTMYRTKFTVSKLKRRCSVFPVDKNEDFYSRPVEVREGVAMMPWSLTHTATQHKLQSRFPGEGMFKGITDYIRQGSTAVEAVGSYLRKIPVLGAAKQAEKKADEELKQIQAMLKETRLSLGRNKEARRSLEEHYNAIMARMAQTKVDIDADAAAFDKAKKAEEELDKEIMAIKEKIISRKATQANDSEPIDPYTQAQIARSAEVHNVSIALRNEVVKRMNASAKVLETLKSQNYQMETAIEESKARVPDTEMRAENLKKSIANVTANIATLNRQKAHLLHEESEEEVNMAKEDHQLIVSSQQLQTCDDWGRRLEKKIKQVIDSNKADDKLCHKSILGLHSERIKLKQELHKQHTEIKKQEEEAASAEHKGDETLNMLNHCLGRLKGG